MANRLTQFVSDHDDLDVVDGKITCTLTGHEFGSVERGSEKPEQTLKTIEVYLGGKKYKMMKENYSRDFKQYPHIIPHKTHPKRLYCTLCSFPLNRIPQQVEDHLSGRRHKCRLREQENGTDDLDLPEGLQDMVDSDKSDEDEEMEQVVVEEEEDTGFEVVQQDEDLKPSFTLDSSKYDSSGEEEAPAPVAGHKRATSARPSGNRPRRKKNKRGNK